MSGSDRSVRVGGNITGSSVVAGDHNIVNTRMTQHVPPAPESVDVKAELAALREALTALAVPERGKLDRAMQDAAEEAGKAEPDKEEVAGALERAVKHAKAAEEFTASAERLVPRIAALGAWLGTHGRRLLAMVGIEA